MRELFPDTVSYSLLISAKLLSDSVCSIVCLNSMLNILYSTPMLSIFFLALSFPLISPRHPDTRLPFPSNGAGTLVTNTTAILPN